MIDSAANTDTIDVLCGTDRTLYVDRRWRFSWRFCPQQTVAILDAWCDTWSGLFSRKICPRERWVCL